MFLQHRHPDLCQGVFLNHAHLILRCLQNSKIYACVSPSFPWGGRAVWIGQHRIVLIYTCTYLCRYYISIYQFLWSWICACMGCTYASMHDRFLSFSIRIEMKNQKNQLGGVSFHFDFELNGNQSASALNSPRGVSFHFQIEFHWRSIKTYSATPQGSFSFRCNEHLIEVHSKSALGHPRQVSFHLLLCAVPEQTRNHLFGVADLSRD